MTPRTPTAIFQQYTSDASGRQPIASFRAFPLYGEHLEAAARKHNDRNAGVPPAGGIDRHRRPGHIGHCPLRCSFRPRNGLRIGDHAWPDRDLHMTWRWLPNGRLRAKIGPLTDRREKESHQRHGAPVSAVERHYCDFDPRSFSNPSSSNPRNIFRCTSAETSAVKVLPLCHRVGL
jgi:hypothetical protein